MNETEFRIACHARLCDLADLVLAYHNPCQARLGACLKGDPNPCCIRTRFKRFEADKRCMFIGENGCELPNIECKVWLCELALEQADPKALAALKALEDIAKLYGLTNEQ